MPPASGEPRTGTRLTARVAAARRVRALCDALEAARPFLVARGLDPRCLVLVAEFLLGED